MADVFLSYASQDRDVARALAKALDDHGWSVFWDRTIPPGHEFDVVIGNALRDAKCVVVLWSTASVGSRWVKEEAEDAATRGILVPAVLDDAPLPLGFRRLQTARLAGWPSDSRAVHEFQGLVAAIATFVGRPTHPAPVPDSPRAHVRAAAHTASHGRRHAASQVALGISVVAGIGVGVWSQLYNSDVGFVAAVPVWIVGGLLALAIRRLG